jgi:transcriptional regulator with XRE-family HTH domain
MPKRAPSPGLGERLKRVRLRLGFQNLADFARKIGQNYTTYRQWELFDAAPSAETLKKTCRLLQVKGWPQLFLWVCDGSGDPPSWLENTDEPIPEATEDDEEEALPPRPSVTGVRRVPIPWRALEVLVQQGRQADERKDQDEVRKLEAAVRELVWPDLPRRSDAKSTPQTQEKP